MRTSRTEMTQWCSVSKAEFIPEYEIKLFLLSSQFFRPSIDTYIEMLDLDDGGLGRYYLDARSEDG